MMEISMELTDEPGSLATVAEALAEANINIETMCAIGKVAPNVALVTEQIPQTRAVLDKMGVKYTVTELIKMVMPDQPGVLAAFSRRIADAGLNLNSIYILSKYQGDTELVFSVDDTEKARQVLNLHESVPP
ncbi:MAG: ACT domain-containing protein [Candidatus Thalassarchaeaceae archaeon]|nr:ACT domain-containing protein [Candidatus Thalassarchaeaceae archaeon]MDP7043824.1 ACT domain-containing protein [Candidatus Thalassarchaeaceae archaeon]